MFDFILKRVKPLFYVGQALSLGASVMRSVAPLIFTNAISTFSQEEETAPNDTVVHLFVTYGVLIGASKVLDIMGDYLTTHDMERISSEESEHALVRLNKFSFSEYQKADLAKVFNTILDYESLNNYLSNNKNIALGMIEVIIVCGISFGEYHYSVPLGFMLSASVYGLMLYGINRQWGGEYSKKQSQAFNRLSATLNEILRLENQELIRAYGAVNYELAFYRQDKKLYDSERKKKRNFLTGVKTIAEVVNGVALTVGLWVIGKDLLTEDGQYDVKDIFWLNTFFVQLLSPITGLFTKFSDATDAETEASQLLLLLSPQDGPRAPNPKPSSEKIDDGQIIFNKVNFKAGENLLFEKELDFTIPFGSVTAIVGGSGSGKTTIARLLTKIYSPSTGKIFVGGKDISTLESDSICAAIAYAPATPVLFSRKTLKQNVLYKFISQSQTQVEYAGVSAAAKTAKIDGLYEAHKDKRTPHNLSNGEKQRLHLARAFVRKPLIYVLDEPTSALDVNTEARLYKDFLSSVRASNLRPTVIVITHKLSFAKMADQILVLKSQAKGSNLIDYGSHAELLGRCGYYKELWAEEHDEKQVLRSPQV